MGGAGIKLRRSLLITPGDDELLLSKAARSRADVTVLDWEDGVYASRKSSAREITARALGAEDWSGHEVVVRINGSDTAYFEDDLEAAATLPIAGVRIAKVRSPDDIHRAAHALEAIEDHLVPQPRTRLAIWASIETAEGLVAVNRIAACHPRLAVLTFGGGDLGADLGILRLELGDLRTFGPVQFEYLYGQSRVVAAARANRLDAINMAHSSYKDLEGTQRDARFAAQLGFSGAIALSPRQVDVINSAFSPSADDVAWATGIVKQFEAANSERERTVIVVRDEMADGPLVRNARRILSLNEAIETKAASRAV